MSGKGRSWAKKASAGVAVFAIMTSAGVATATLFDPLRGSDTLLDPIRAAIASSGVQINYTGGGSGTGESAMNSVPPTQGIAPMSRNLRAAIISAHPTWAPTTANVIGLDGAVAVQKATPQKCPNIQEFVNGTAAVGPATHWLKLILGGVDGTGSTAACSHPARLAALDALANCAHVDHVEHFFRRDDNSGTTDTMKERLGVCLMCNGNSRGPNNLGNPDGDPIRRSCISGPGLAATPCRASDNTAGLVIALTDPDPGRSDVTVTIGNRVAADPDGVMFGYAGREAGVSVTGATKFNVHTIVPSFANIRSSLYPLSRRLFLQRGPLDDPNMNVVDPSHEQAKLLAWVTGIGADAQPALCGDGLCGRPKMDPIMKAKGFVPCLDNPFDEPGPDNLCGVAPDGFVDAVCTACKANPMTCTTGSECCSGTCTSGVCQTCLASQSVCSTGGQCCSGTCVNQGQLFNQCL